MPAGRLSRQEGWITPGPSTESPAIQPAWGMSSPPAQRRCGHRVVGCAAAPGRHQRRRGAHGRPGVRQPLRPFPLRSEGVVASTMKGPVGRGFLRPATNPMARTTAGRCGWRTASMPSRPMPSRRTPATGSPTSMEATSGSASRVRSRPALRARWVVSTCSSRWAAPSDPRPSREYRLGHAALIARRDRILGDDRSRISRRAARRDRVRRGGTFP